ncbi:vesicular glutamate transporter 3 [Plakobranchus ocellatus]|uniref:Vesicular glutamate transporter 3 n=1 Tax=Plakobranchus ocellatus TaxID=259542 RepID=A0AAV4AZ02_9GAST|nr:vesicular glutamate transporter 3 [Plakobranchus ocellatus]
MKELRVNNEDNDNEKTFLLVNGDSQDSNPSKEEDSESRESPEHSTAIPSGATSKRWQVAYLMFFGCFFQYALRVDLSVAIVCMCNGSLESNTSNSIQNKAEFDWGESTKSTLLSAYFYGYLVLQVPGGWLAGKYGATRVISFSMALSALCTVLLPVAARNSIVAFYALRVLIGLFTGAIFPAFQSLWGRWAPTEERTKLAGFSYSGEYDPRFARAEAKEPFIAAQDGLLSAIPSVCQFASSITVGSLADFMRGRGIPTGMVRKMFQFATFVGRGLCLVAAGYVTHDKRYVAVALLGGSGLFAGLQQAGYVANFIDIAPRFTGVMYGFGNSMATLSGIVSPIVVGAVTTENTRTEWQTVFFVCAGLSIMAVIVFVCFAKGHVQEWAIEPPSGSCDGDLYYSVVVEPGEREDNDKTEGS